MLPLCIASHACVQRSLGLRSLWGAGCEDRLAELLEMSFQIFYKSQIFFN